MDVRVGGKFIVNIKKNIVSYGYIYILIDKIIYFNVWLKFIFGNVCFFKGYFSFLWGIYFLIFLIFFDNFLFNVLLIFILFFIGFLL